MTSYHLYVPVTEGEKTITGFSPGFLPNGGLHRLSHPFTIKYPAGLFEWRRIPLQVVLRKRTCNNNEFYPF